MTTPAGYRRTKSDENPRLDSPDYESTRKRVPIHAPIRLEHTLSEITGPRSWAVATPADADLTHFNNGEALGERIIVAGRVLDDDGRALAGTLIEIWQANSAGRYAHDADNHDAPLDPHFSGVGRVVTGADGSYRFTTIKPGAYPWRNHPNAWRPAHIHFSLFGPAFATRLVTQMYFPGDPLLPLDPILSSIPDQSARNRLVAAFDLVTTVPGYALGYRFDFVLRGREETPAVR
ncbi:MAG TPA: protocatechuate 3,4-dioxygenase subunit beta [Candidatus Binataceae bacterium]|nr:protocatechuate 3,4-dioxygenase subunit beta [Candidatus Binataceae bacterium]